MKLQVYRPWIPSVLEVFGLGSDQALSSEEEDKEARIAQMSSPTSAWNSQVAAWRSSKPAGRKTCSCPDVRDSELGWVPADVAGSKPSEIPATVELDELKELYKKKKTLKHDKHKHIATCHIESKGVAHTLHAHLQQKQRILSYIDSPLEPHLHTHQGYINIKSHTHTHTHSLTHTIKHQRS